jgi:hypothetical protein
MNYLKIYEEFESPSYYDAQYDKSGKWTNEDLVDMLSVIALIWNHGVNSASANKTIDPNNKYQSFDKFTKMVDRFFDEPFRFINDSDLFDWSDDYNWDSLTPDNREEIAKIYKDVYKEFSLGDFPDMDDIDDILVHLKDLTEVELTISLSDRAGLSRSTLNFNIQTTPSIKTFPNANLIPFDLDEWDSIVMEIKPAVDRIKDLGYNCKIFMKPYNKIIIQVTLL